MLIAMLLVILMNRPGLALFYGGLTRSKNMLSVLWVLYACDVFRVHGVGGIVGAILIGVFAAQTLGGTGGATPYAFNMGAQV
jgi:ammonia channel protein AmtB